jgi:hypothetical protein
MGLSFFKKNKIKRSFKFFFQPKLSIAFIFYIYLNFESVSFKSNLKKFQFFFLK